MSERVQRTCGHCVEPRECQLRFVSKLGRSVWLCDTCNELWLVGEPPGPNQFAPPLQPRTVTVKPTLEELDRMPRRRR